MHKIESAMELGKRSAATFRPLVSVAFLKRRIPSAFAAFMVNPINAGSFEV